MGKSNDNGVQRDIQRSLRLLVTVTIIAIFVLSGLLLYWSFYPYEPLVIHTDPIDIVAPADKVVTQGSYLTYEFEYTKNTDVKATVHRQFIDGLVFDVANSGRPTQTSRTDSVARGQVYVPETLPPGSYRMKSTVIYQVNPIREVQSEYVSEEFEVIASQ